MFRYNSTSSGMAMPSGQNWLCLNTKQRVFQKMGFCSVSLGQREKLQTSCTETQYLIFPELKHLIRNVEQWSYQTGFLKARYAHYGSFFCPSIYLMQKLLKVFASLLERCMHNFCIITDVAGTKKKKSQDKTQKLWCSQCIFLMTQVAFDQL